jgi:hypothetical protein
MHMYIIMFLQSVSSVMMHSSNKGKQTWGWCFENMRMAQPALVVA